MCWWETRSCGEAPSRASSSQLSPCWRYVQNWGFVRVWCHEVENLRLASSWHSTIKDAYEMENSFYLGKFPHQHLNLCLLVGKKTWFFFWIERSDPIIQLSWLYPDSDMMCVSVSLWSAVSHSVCQNVPNITNSKWLDVTAHTIAHTPFELRDNSILYPNQIYLTVCENFAFY